MFTNEPIKVDQVSIHVSRGKVYIPSTATYPSTVVDADPVYVTGLNIGEMIPEIEKARASGWKELPEPTDRKKVLRDAAKVLLKATKTSNWKELARSGPSYLIGWTNNGIKLSISQLDKKGRYEFPVSKEILFSVDTPLEKILDVVIKDVRQRTKNLE